MFQEKVGKWNLHANRKSVLKQNPRNVQKLQMYSTKKYIFTKLWNEMNWHHRKEFVINYVEKLVLSRLGSCSVKILDYPSKVWNMNETAVFLSSKGRLLLAQEGKAAYDITSTSEKDNVTTLIAANAAAELAPPLYQSINTIGFHTQIMMQHLQIGV